MDNSNILKLNKMISMQENMNVLSAGENWKYDDIPWHRAIWIECGELTDHYGWKWWKKQEPNTEQVKLELVDIWHFVLSLMMSTKNDDGIVDNTNTQRMIEYVDRCMDGAGIRNIDNINFLDIVEEFVSCILNPDEMLDLELFFVMCRMVDMNFNELYKIYMAKNVLNVFRQNNGYKSGSYIKDWNGREDNEVLMKIMNTVDMTDKTIEITLYEKLLTYYNDNVVTFQIS